MSNENFLFESPELFVIDKSGKLRTWKQKVVRKSEDEVVLITISGLYEGSKTFRSKALGPVQGRNAKRRADILLRNNVKRKLREGYTKTKEAALETGQQVKPMRATDYIPGETVLQAHNILLQPKIKGIRSYYTPVTDDMLSRGGVILNIPHIRNRMRQLHDKMGYPPDGELYVPGLTEPEILSVISNRDHPRYNDLQYYVFDGISEKIQRERCADINKFYWEMFHEDPYIQQVPTIGLNRGFNVHEEIKKVHEQHLYDKWEGTIIRIADAPYEYGRSLYLFRWKPVDCEEFPIVGITYEHRLVHGWEQKLVQFECQMPDGKVFTVVPAWSVEERYGFYLKYRKANHKELAKNLPPLKVEYRGLTSGGYPSQPVGIMLRDPKY